MTTQIYDQLLIKYPVGHPLCQTPSAFINDALQLILYGNTLDSNTNTNPPELAPQSSSFTLVPGILHGEQNLGDGQPNVMRLIDYSDNSLHDLKVSDIKSKINFYINENDEIVLSCVENSTINERDISGMGVVSMLFNIIDSSGVVNIQSDISLNFINNDISNSSIFTISGDISGTYIPSLDNPDDISYINNENTILQIINNNLVIGISSENVSSGYINKLLFKIAIEGSENILNDEDIFINISPATAYDLSYSSETFEISLNNIDGLELIEFSNNEYIIGEIIPYAYSIQPIINLSNIAYYNINNLSFKKKNLLVLSSNNQILGNLSK